MTNPNSYFLTAFLSVVVSASLGAACSGSESPSSGGDPALAAQGGGPAAGGEAGSAGGASSGQGGATSDPCAPYCDVYNGTHAIDLTADPPCRRVLRAEPELIFCDPSGSCGGLGLGCWVGSEHDGLLEYQLSADCRSSLSNAPGWRSLSDEEQALVDDAPLCPDQPGAE
jgi:hypothetical protein